MKGFNKLIGQSPEFLAIIRAAQVVSALDVTVLILGESGTGKELLAHAIHLESPRKDKPFVTINCAALPESLVESELFGHRKGAFTGAVADNKGRIRSAEGGTVFLDEIGELSPNIQAKLLRFLEDGECQAIGQAKPCKVDTRLIAATNRDLYNQVKAGEFRKDLYYRLHVVPLELPPLRQREGDFTLLTHHFICTLAEYHKVEPPQFSDESLKILKDYRWPGNVRELRNFCERMVALYRGRTIHPELLPREIIDGEIKKSLHKEFVFPDTGISLDAFEAQIIRQALVKAKGNKSKAARLLGITRNTLLYRMTKYAIEF